MGREILSSSIEENEKPEDAVIREVEEETNLIVKIIEKIGFYNEEGRDPRGNVHSTAYKCMIIGDVSLMKSGLESEEVKLVSIEKLIDMELAFDHKEILKDAKIFK
jgi:8-oxo-dGTP diphosphatase